MVSEARAGSTSEIDALKRSHGDRRLVGAAKVQRPAAFTPTGSGPHAHSESRRRARRGFHHRTRP